MTKLHANEIAGKKVAFDFVFKLFQVLCEMDYIKKWLCAVANAELSDKTVCCCSIV